MVFCRERGPPCVATGALLVSRQCFILCRDDVITEGPLSRRDDQGRGSRLLQELG